MTKFQTKNTRRTNLSSDLHDQVPNQEYKKDQYSDLHDQVPNHQYKKDQYI